MVYFKASSDCPKCVEAEREEALHEAKSAPHKAHYVPASNVYPYDHKSKVL